MTISKIKAVAFDLDGLMFDTEKNNYRVNCELMRRRGREYTDELCQAVMGTPPKASFMMMIQWYSLNDAWQEMQKESDAIFLKLIEEEGVEPMPGLFELLNEIERRKIPKCICTSNTPYFARLILDAYNMAPRFDFILTSQDIVHGKPNPEVYLKAAERFEIEPSSLMVFEDSVQGSLAARSAGAFTVVVLADHNKTQHFPHASRIVHQLNAPEILGILTRSFLQREV
ncbi:MAG: HAD family phosphatase [Planctomycetaceae bacterium]|jgi:HAD superfamily hydrolase (TIGR01509 family)|nr:HAD family phosphatase [Planctomycetaceae bacterium]